MKQTFTILFLLAFGCQLSAQAPTVGLLYYKPSQSWDGYNLIYPHNQPNVYLLNNCGEIVHTWTDDADFRPGNTAYIMENGDVIKTKRPSMVVGNPIWAGGGGATVERRTWDNDLLWSFTANDSLQRLHHDIAPMPNGNVLMIAWELRTEEEAIQAGRDMAKLAEGELWPEKIIEFDPSTESIVWEWYVWDHLIQDFDATKDNFGVVADHPELIDLNYDTEEGAADWLHANSLDYNPTLDQIMISIPTFNEIWIIDHSTTTEEAASSSGGMANRGGDLLYRLGNPAAYRAGTVDDQMLFYQHDAHWVDDFIPANFPHRDKIAVFNNRVGADYSTAHAFFSPWNMYEWKYDQNLDGVWGPTAFDLTYEHPVRERLFSTGLSSFQFLPNGNTLICSGRFGYTFEMTPDRNIVWEYRTPLRGGIPVSQGDSLAINNNLTFRMTRYPLDFAGFDGRTLAPQGYIELNPREEYCNSVISNVAEVQRYGLKIFPNPAQDQLTIVWEEGMYVDLELYDLLGRRVGAIETSGGRRYHDISYLEDGVYFVLIDGVEVQKLVIAR
ncbi:MAG: aryl-sulfate sulfotransferase [Bacteroidota bacterium]